MTEGFARYTRAVLGLVVAATVAFQLGRWHDAPGHGVAAQLTDASMVVGLLAAVSLIVTAAASDPRDPRFDGLRGAACLSGVVVAVTCLASEAVPAWPLPQWVLPLALTADWCLWPPRRRVTARLVAAWSAPLLLYPAIVFLLGGLGGWYPVWIRQVTASGVPVLAAVAGATAVTTGLLAVATLRRDGARRPQVGDPGMSGTADAATSVHNP
ncbi:hypothetical protein LX16_4733 [Stackebrandtia albiflava]|uniref:Uncharacterized protein n=1 Tax=Stackebrandtia albiflava TaxID=406432 RepID=A0A562UQR1_9ACTN|nr:hypothetical protein [Stackebrandtia albiflava]TWJ07950.1 hypothetical protein LX16_4733 [Stackebrandtia albiflava]